MVGIFERIIEKAYCTYAKTVQKNENIDAMRQAIKQFLNIDIKKEDVRFDPKYPVASYIERLDKLMTDEFFGKVYEVLTWLVSERINSIYIMFTTDEVDSGNYSLDSEEKERTTSLGLGEYIGYKRWDNEFVTVIKIEEMHINDIRIYIYLRIFTDALA